MDVMLRLHVQKGFKSGGTLLGHAWKNQQTAKYSNRCTLFKHSFILQ